MWALSAVAKLSANFSRKGRTMGYTGKDVADMVWQTLIVIALIAFSLVLAGCSLAPQAVKVNAAKGVTKYCETFTYAQRSGVLRPEFNTLIAPHQAAVHCYGDPENPKKEEKPAQ